MNDKKKILFVTGTRADFGKLKPLIKAVDKSEDFECLIFVTGMHVLSRYGLTAKEVYRAGFHNVFTYMNHVYGEPMEVILANTILGLSRYMTEYTPDMVVIHGDRVEALAGAIVGSLRNILVGHIEGGEVSGTIDELIRHSITKLAHLHFVSNERAKNRLIQLGENEKSIFIIGSPDIDIMLSKTLPSLDTVKKYYEIPFPRYGMVIYHPVTTEAKKQRRRAEELVAALLRSDGHFVVIYPNNDLGADEIVAAYKQIKGNPRFKIYSSMRFEYFLTLIKHADFILGNSSAGIHEAPVYGVPTINIGKRQHNRFYHESILNVACNREAILEGIARALDLEKFPPCNHFGDGHSTRRFLTCLQNQTLWSTPKQKQFIDIINSFSLHAHISEIKK